MLRYSANYSNTNSNFVICNIANNHAHHVNSKYNDVICILKNILQRGCPTKPSVFLQNYIKNTDDQYFPFINTKAKLYPHWDESIRGYDAKDLYTAREYYNMLCGFSDMDSVVARNLIIPEFPVNQIADTEEGRKQSDDIKMDFYIPQAALAIEIDGSQHEEILNQKKDQTKERILSQAGVEVIRIRTKEITESKAKEVVAKIKTRATENGMSCYYESHLQNGSTQGQCLATAVMRIQLFLLSLLEYSIISLDDDEWRFCLKFDEWDLIGQTLDQEENFFDLAVEDDFIWLEQLLLLQDKVFHRPNISLNFINSPNEFELHKNEICIDFSLLNRLDDTTLGKRGIYFIRTDCFEFAIFSYDKNTKKSDWVKWHSCHRDYFKVSVDKKIDYDVNKERKQNQLEFFLKNIFGFSEFKPKQIDIVVSALNGNCTLGILPTGSGKTVCYELASILEPCINIVVSPLRSLMSDQKDVLISRHRFNRIEIISSDDKAVAKDYKLRQFGNLHNLITWVSPERFQIQGFRDQLKEIKNNIGIVTVDEAHCVSEWGQEFRTSYLCLNPTIHFLLPSATVMGVTATASNHVLKDLQTQFGVHIQGTSNRINIIWPENFNRDELHFYVYNIPSGKKSSQLLEILKKYKGHNYFKIDGENTHCGVVFAAKKERGKGNCKEIATLIKEKISVDCLYYYSNDNAPEEEKVSENFNRFMKNEVPIICSTKAFGMGIDKGNIRYTIHYQIPGSLESLYQEAGRAGRNIRDPNIKTDPYADCHVIFSPASIGNEEYNKIFSSKISIEGLRRIINEEKPELGDLETSFYFLMENNIGVNEEAEIVYQLYRDIAKKCSDFLKSGKPIPPIGKQNFVNTYMEKVRGKQETKQFSEQKSWNRRKQSYLSNFEKYLYRLKILGIVEDWTIDFQTDNYTLKMNDKFIEAFKARDQKARCLQFCKDSVTNFIRRYEPDDLVPQAENSRQLIHALISWIYSHIVYSRRQAIKTIYDNCVNHYNNPDEFVKTIEDYFSVSDPGSAYSLMLNNSEQISACFPIFQEMNSKTIKQRIARDLESYENHMGLNFLSGLARLNLNEFDDPDGKQRLERALNSLKIRRDIGDSKKKEILSSLLRTCQDWNMKQRNILSKIVIGSFPDQLESVYQELKDEYSASMIILQFADRIQKVGRTIYDRLG